MAPPIPIARGVKPYSSKGFASKAGAHTTSTSTAARSRFIGGVSGRGRRLAGVEEVLEQAEELGDDLFLDHYGERGHKLLALFGGQRVGHQRGYRIARGVVAVGVGLFDALDDQPQRAAGLAG